MEPISLLSSDEENEPLPTRLTKKDEEIRRQNAVVAQVEGFVKTYEKLLRENVNRLQREVKIKDRLLNEKQKLLDAAVATARPSSSRNSTNRRGIKADSPMPISMGGKAVEKKPAKSRVSKVETRDTPKASHQVVMKVLSSEIEPSTTVQSPLKIGLSRAIDPPQAPSSSHDQALRTRSPAPPIRLDLERPSTILGTKLVRLKLEPLKTSDEASPLGHSSPKPVPVKAEPIKTLETAKAFSGYSTGISTASVPFPNSSLPMLSSISFGTSSGSVNDTGPSSQTTISPSISQDNKDGNGITKKKERGSKYGPFCMDDVSSDSSSAATPSCSTRISIKKSTNPVPRKRRRLVRKEKVSTPISTDDSSNEWEGPLMSPESSKSKGNARKPYTMTEKGIQANDSEEELPLPLQEMINQQPSPEVSLYLPDEPLTFSRLYISAIVGGQPQGTWPTPSKSKDFVYWIGDYVCLNRELNTMMPEKPGDKGCIFLCGTNGGEAGKTYPVFIKKDSSEWGYFGTYKLSQLYQTPLSQWKTLFTNEEKVRWSKHLLEQKRQWGRKKLLRKRLFTETELKQMTPQNSWQKILKCFTKADDDLPNLRLLVRFMQPVGYDRELERVLVEKYSVWKDDRSLAKSRGRMTNKNNLLARKRPRNVRGSSLFDLDSDALSLDDFMDDD